MPLISVIMPAYNASQFIEEAIDSILGQTESDFELLICDDGSTDNTLKIIQNYNDSRIRVFINAENKGNLYTTNLLFQECNGKFTTIQDADDYSNPNRFSTLIQQFRNDSELGLVGSNYEIVNEIKESISCGLLPITNQEIQDISTKEVVPILYASAMIKTEILKKVGFFPIFFNRIGYADLDLLSRCSEVCKVANIRDILYYYRQHSNSFNFQHYKNMKKGLILEHMDALLVDAHNKRVQNGEDYFKTNNTSQMYRFISNIYIKKAENLFWENKNKLAIVSLGKALKISPFNFSGYKTMFYILRKVISQK